MTKCAKCGKRGKGTFCAYCGTKYPVRTTKEPTHRVFDHISPNVKKIGLVILVAVLAVAVSFAIFVGSGALAKETKLSIQVLGEGCTREVSYNLQATDSSLRPLANKELALNIDGTTLERLHTDNNGKIQSRVTIPSSVCGRNVSIEAKFAGDALHKAASAITYVDARRPTLIVADLPSKIEIGSHTSLKLTLSDDSTKTSLDGAELDVTVADETRKHISGSGDFDTVFPDESSKTFVVRYWGNNEFLPAVYSRDDLTLVVPRCSDGTAVGACSNQIGYYCIEGKHITFDCNKCGCEQGKICTNNQCLTQEQALVQTIARLENSVVKIETPVAQGVSQGSGVILEQTSSQTIILTNRHVIEDADSASAIRVVDNTGMIRAVSAAKIAPSGLDLAIVYVNALVGSSAVVRYSEDVLKGSSVIALGSPRGLQGSVTSGIVSNFNRDYPTLSVRYPAIQTDAAINHGNSGGGLFLKSDGRLVGINSAGFGDWDFEGLNFAIDIREISGMDTSSWQQFTPTKKCEDGTPYGSCSQVYAGYGCDNGDLVAACRYCPCSNQAPYCPESGECFGCPAGTSPYQDSDGNGVCV